MSGEYVAVRSAGKLSRCIFLSWKDAAPHLAADLQGAQYKVFHTFLEAESYIQADAEQLSRKRKAPPVAALHRETQAELEEKIDDDDDVEDDEEEVDCTAVDQVERFILRNSSTATASHNEKIPSTLKQAPANASSARKPAPNVAAAPKVPFTPSTNPPTKTWEIGFHELAATAVDGKLPEVQKDAKIRRFISRQNAEYTKLMRQEHSSMTHDKIKRLKSIGFVFPSKKQKFGSDFDDEFDTMLEKLKTFKSENGHCRVTKNHTEHKDLFLWIVKMRGEYKKLSETGSSKCRLTAQHMQRLTDLGFLFRQKSKYKSWRERMDDLLAYQAAGNNINQIKLQHELGEFVGRMRKEYRLYIDGCACAMTQERVDALHAAGFDFNINLHRDKSALPKPKTWEERFAELSAYNDAIGDTLVPKGMEGGLGYVRVHCC